MKNNRLITIKEDELIELIKSYGGGQNFFKNLKRATDEKELKHPNIDDYSNVEDYIKAIYDYVNKKQCIESWEHSLSSYLANVEVTDINSDKEEK